MIAPLDHRRFPVLDHQSKIESLALTPLPATVAITLGLWLVRSIFSLRSWPAGNHPGYSELSPCGDLRCGSGSLLLQRVVIQRRLFSFQGKFNGICYGYRLRGSSQADTYINQRRKQKASKFNNPKVMKLAALGSLALWTVSSVTSSISKFGKKIFKKS